MMQIISLVTYSYHILSLLRYSIRLSMTSLEPHSSVYTFFFFYCSVRGLSDFVPRQGKDHCRFSHLSIRRFVSSYEETKVPWLLCIMFRYDGCIKTMAIDAGLKANEKNKRPRFVHEWSDRGVKCLGRCLVSVSALVCAPWTEPLAPAKT